VSSARRLYLTPGELDLLRRRLDLPAPPGFSVDGGSGSMARLEELGVITSGAVHPSVAAGLVAACAPRVGVLVTASVGDSGVTAALGVRGSVGGSLAQSGSAAAEVATWPATELGAELARVVPPLGAHPAPALHLPLEELTGSAVEGRFGPVTGALQATVVADGVLGLLRWLATEQGWLAVEPAQWHAGGRQASVRPVLADDLGAELAPYLATALS
jgi:hypothetical protein